MREWIGNMVARVSMIWHALTARNCIVTWLENGQQYSAYVVYKDELPSDFMDGINTEA